MSYRHQVAEELGKLGSIQDKSRGWWVHSVLLLEATTFRTVGLLHQEWWMRPDDPADADEKESGKWLAAAATSRLRMGSMMSNVIAVCDREADIHAYLQDKLAHNERFVVRQAPTQGRRVWVVSVRPSEEPTGVGWLSDQHSAKGRGG